MIDCDQPWNAADTHLTRRKRGVTLRRLLRSPGGMVGLVLVVLVLLVAIFAPVLSPHDPAKQNIVHRLKPPFWVEGGSLEHPLGTDSVGRDVLSRVIYGSRISLFVGLAATAASALLGVSLLAVVCAMAAGSEQNPCDQDGRSANTAPAGRSWH